MDKRELEIKIRYIDFIVRCIKDKESITTKEDVLHFLKGSKSALLECLDMLREMELK